MGRSVLMLVVVVIVVGLPVWYAWWRQPAVRKQGSRRQIVLDEMIQSQAREIYVEWERTISLVERLLAADEVLPLFPSTQLRREAEARVKQFNQKQLDK